MASCLPVKVHPAKRFMRVGRMSKLEAEFELKFSYLMAAVLEYLDFNSNAEHIYSIFIPLCGG